MANKPRIKPELLDELLEGQDPSKLFQSEGLLDELKKALAEQALEASGLDAVSVRHRPRLLGDNVLPAEVNPKGGNRSPLRTISRIFHGFQWSPMSAVFA